MIDVDALVKATAIVGGVTTTVGVTAAVAWRFFAAFNSKTDKTTTERIFKLTDVQGKEIAGMGKDVAAMGKDVDHLTGAVTDISTDVKAILRNGKRG